jgi:hypothetical protein
MLRKVERVLTGYQLTRLSIAPTMLSEGSIMLSEGPTRLSVP